MKKKALELSRACYMFTSVLMRPSGVQYHIDLAQNILSTAMHSDALKNELYAQLIKLTSGSMPYGIQVCYSFPVEICVASCVGIKTDLNL